MEFKQRDLLLLYTVVQVSLQDLLWLNKSNEYFKQKTPQDVKMLFTGYVDTRYEMYPRCGKKKQSEK